jgi:lipopolysaccharide export system permease protein
VSILSRYILKEHIGPFLFAFFTVTFVLIIDFIPQVIDLIIGKDLSTWTVLKFFVLNLAWMLALSLPMAVLVSTIMAFGRLTSDHEILAIKSAGINMVRLMIPVIIAACGLALFLVWFNNEVLPDANHAASTLRGDIQKMRPTFQLRSGVFIDYIPGYIIQIDKIDYKTNDLEGVIIYDQKDSRSAKTITADSGTVEFSSKGEYIAFHLKDGEIYEQDLTKEGSYRLSSFESQTFIVQNLGTRLEESERSYRGDREMSAGQLAEKTHAWQKEIDSYRKIIRDDTDSALSLVLSAPKEPVTLKNPPPGSIEKAAIGKAYQVVNNVTRNLRTRKGQIHSNTKMVNTYDVEIEKKFSLPMACLTFVLIGAPLGVMGRKGGMALSVGISIVLFLIYWAFLIGGEQLADRLIIAPWIAMWAANIILIAVGLILILRVKNEKPVLSLLARIFWRRNK